VDSSTPLALLPQSPENVTVYGLRPKNLSFTLENKDSADAAGDIFFWISDRLVAPYACRVSEGNWWGCHEQGTLDHDSVYTKSVIAVDSTWPNKTKYGECSSDPGHACYAACNPSDQSGSEWRCNCNSNPNRYGGVPCDVVGRADIKVRYLECADGCHYPNDQWKSDLSKMLGGLWYSTPSEAECGNPAANGECRWTQLEVLKTINASCANDKVLAAVQAKGEDCFSKCSAADRKNVTSDCSTICFFQTVVGKSKSFPNITNAQMSSEELVQPWLGAFESDDVARGGCPSL